MMEARKLPPPLPPPLPPRLDWFVQTQVEQLAQDGVPEWLHGAISRETAEDLLDSQPLGTFLIRVSHSHVGYTLSYRAPGCCRHFMVKLLDDGSVVVPGEQAPHASLHELVTFYQQHPLRPYGELLTRPCGQPDPANVDYEDLLLYSAALAEEAAPPARDPSALCGPWSCAGAAPHEAPTKPVSLRGPQDGKPSAEMGSASTEETSASCPTKALLGGARQKLWKSLKMLPQRGKRAQQRLRSRLAAVSLPLLWDPGQPAANDGSRPRAGSQDGWEARGPASPSQPPAPRDREAPPKEVLRSASWGGAALAERVVRALSRQVSKQEPQKSWLPEEYRPPPPFAPGYC